MLQHNSVIWEGVKLKIEKRVLNLEDLIWRASNHLSLLCFLTTCYRLPLFACRPARTTLLCNAACCDQGHNFGTKFLKFLKFWFYWIPPPPRYDIILAQIFIFFQFFMNLIIFCSNLMKFYSIFFGNFGISTTTGTKH